MDQSLLLASRFARGNLWTTLSSLSLASLEAIDLSVSSSKPLASLEAIGRPVSLLSLSLRSRQLVDQSPFLASRFA